MSIEQIAKTLRTPLNKQINLYGNCSITLFQLIKLPGQFARCSGTSMFKQNPVADVYHCITQKTFNDNQRSDVITFELHKVALYLIAYGFGLGHIDCKEAIEDYLLQGKAEIQYLDNEQVIQKSLIITKPNSEDKFTFKLRFYYHSECQNSEQQEW